MLMQNMKIGTLKIHNLVVGAFRKYFDSSVGPAFSAACCGECGQNATRSARA